MTVALSKAILSSPNLRPIQVSKIREAALKMHTIDILRAQGYILEPMSPKRRSESDSKMPPSLWATAKGDVRSTVAIKVSSDRWMGLSTDVGGGFGIVSQTIKVAIVTFDQDYRLGPERLQVYLVDAKRIIAAGKLVYEERNRKGQTGTPWLPLDDRPERSGTSVSGGHIVTKDDLIFDDLIEWYAETEGDPIVPDMTKPEVLDPEKYLEAARKMVAEREPTPAQKVFFENGAKDRVKTRKPLFPMNSSYMQGWNSVPAPDDLPLDLSAFAEIGLTPIQIAKRYLAAAEKVPETSIRIIVEG